MRPTSGVNALQDARGRQNTASKAPGFTGRKLPGRHPRGALVTWANQMALRSRAFRYLFRVAHAKIADVANHAALRERASGVRGGVRPSWNFGGSGCRAGAGAEEGKKRGRGRVAGLRRLVPGERGVEGGRRGAPGGEAGDAGAGRASERAAGGWAPREERPQGGGAARPG